MIPVIFITNLDHPSNLEWEWPTEVSVRPMIGDYVEDNNDNIRLKIVSICHVNGRLEVELNK
jgi:hypothetical protein